MKTAKEMADIAKAALDVMHKKWLDSIPQRILENAQNGCTICIIECAKQSDAEEVRNIYEPLGYNVNVETDYWGNLKATISWDTESERSLTIQN